MPMAPQLLIRTTVEKMLEVTLLLRWMYKTSVYTLVNGNIEKVAHRKQQKLQKVILPTSHWLWGRIFGFPIEMKSRR